MSKPLDETPSKIPHEKTKSKVVLTSKYSFRHSRLVHEMQRRSLRTLVATDPRARPPAATPHLLEEEA